jgi:hypothetical protein
VGAEIYILFTNQTIKNVLAFLVFLAIIELSDVLCAKKGKCLINPSVDGFV